MANVLSASEAQTEACAWAAVPLEAAFGPAYARVMAQGVALEQGSCSQVRSPLLLFLCNRVGCLLLLLLRRLSRSFSVRLRGLRFFAHSFTFKNEQTYILAECREKEKAALRAASITVTGGYSTPTELPLGGLGSTRGGTTPLPVDVAPFFHSGDVTQVPAARMAS